MRRLARAAVAVVLAAGIAACGGDEGGSGGGGGGGSTGAESSASDTQTGSISLFDVRKGDCINGVKESEGEQTTVQGVRCNEPHEAEAFAVYELEGDTWPGGKRVEADAEKGCTERAPDAADADFEIFFYTPTEETWKQRDDREVVCLALFERKRDRSLELSE